MSNNFWHERKAVVGVLGGGAWGTVLAKLAAPQCSEVWLWMRDEQNARSLNSSRQNEYYVPGLILPENVRATSEVEKVFERGLDVIVWALPSQVSREQAKKLAKYLRGTELIIHATKGIEPDSLKRVSEVLLEEIPVLRIGVISGPNLAGEISKGLPAATVVASRFEEVLECGVGLFNSPRFKVYKSFDLVGVEWGGVLKNVLSIASGVADALELGENAKAALITRGLSEMIRFAVFMGAEAGTFFGLAGIGDLLATSSGSQSRNYRFGFELGLGKEKDSIFKLMEGATVEGVLTAKAIFAYSRNLNLKMPITEGVVDLVEGRVNPKEVVSKLMARDVGFDWLSF